MNRLSQSLLLATALSCGMAMPAMAAWDRIGGVDVAHHMDHDVSYTRFGGGVDRLRLDAHASDVHCRSVRATFNNGHTREIFKGNIRAGQSRTIDLPGDNRHIRKLSFACRAGARRGGTIAIMADVGSYRGEWQHSPDWNHMWSRMFHWSSTPDRHGDRHTGWDANNWVRVGTETFDGRNDRETTVAGWSGRSVERIALKPLNGDASCNRITARFGNGHKRDLDVNRGARMTQGRVYTFDLPGNDRNVKEVILHCSPLARYPVHVEVLARK